MSLAAFLIPHSSPIVPRMLISRRHHMWNIPPRVRFYILQASCVFLQRVGTHAGDD